MAMTGKGENKMAPMNETTDKAYYEGWRDGYKHAIEDIRQELLTLEADTQTPVGIEIYKILNYMKTKLEEA